VGMNFTIELLNEKIDVKVIKRRTTKHTYLRLKSETLIEISTNIYFTENDAKYLIKNKKEWLEKRLQFLKTNCLSSNEYYFLGTKYEMGNIKIDFDIFYKEKSKEILPKIVDKYSNMMKLFPTKLKYRKNKRVWGSCNYKNEINFNIYLMKLPMELIEYVVIHELAHIKHKNHSKKFWNLVEYYCEDYKKREKLFRSFL
jgi:predicted metal-dependent hydrolase